MRNSNAEWLVREERACRGGKEGVAPERQDENWGGSTSRKAKQKHVRRERII